MSRNLIRDDIRAGAFLNRMIGGPMDYRKAHCYYWGEPSFAIAYYDFRQLYNGTNAEIAVAASDFSFDKSFIKHALAIFYENVKFNNVRLEALISPNNKQAIRLIHLSGFTLEGCKRKVAPDGDRLSFAMLKEEYEVKYGRNIFQAKGSTSATISSGECSGATGNAANSPG